MASIIGTNGNDTGPYELKGTDFADEIYGLGGDDTLVGFAGDDVLEGGAGADAQFGGDGFDFASYGASPAGVQIQLTSAFSAQGGHATGDQLFGIEGVIGSYYRGLLYGDDQSNILCGGDGDDLLSGLAGGDRIHGQGGNDLIGGGSGIDRLLGGVGDDWLDGGAGNDVLKGGAGIDTVGFGYVSSGVVVDLVSGSAIGDASIGSDRLSGIENVLGTGLADRLSGNGSDNVLAGGYGADTLTGRGGADRFDFNSPDDSDPKAPDRILDFSRTQMDKIDFSDIDANEQLNGNQSFDFIGQGAFTGAGQVRYYHEDEYTIIEGDTSTAIGGAEPVIVLDGLISLRARDFIL